MKHVMVDVESLGTVADSVIMSIGAVKFDLDSDAMNDNGFYASVSTDSNMDTTGRLRRTQEDTLIFWLKQNSDAQRVFHEPKDTLYDSLQQFADWLGNDKYYMWSNGADFDLPMLAHAFTGLGIEIPWKFWNSRCFRTYKNLPQAASALFTPNGVKHNALADAVNQARHAQAIQAVLTGRAPPKTHRMVKA